MFVECSNYSNLWSTVTTEPIAVTEVTEPIAVATEPIAVMYQYLSDT